MVITIDKNKIYSEVARSTLYTGAKHPDTDTDMICRVATIDADRPLLDRYYGEAVANVKLALRQVILSVSSSDQSATIGISMSAAADPTLTDTLADDISQYIATYVTSRWLALSCNSTADACASDARSLLDDIVRKTFYKRKPTRPKY